MSYYYIRGNKEKRRLEIDNLSLNANWEGAHRFATVTQIEKGLIGRIDDINYYEKN